jgi:hypothetical protein
MTNTNQLNQLTEAQFTACQDKLDDLIRTSRKDPEAKAVAAAKSAQWERAIALPQRTAQERQARFSAIAATATELGLL